MAIPVGNYYKGGMKPTTAVVIEDFDRAAPKGVGAVKVCVAFCLPCALYLCVCVFVYFVCLRFVLYGFAGLCWRIYGGGLVCGAVPVWLLCHKYILKYIYSSVLYLNRVDSALLVCVSYDISWVI